MSVDPVVPKTTDGSNFNRYWYANGSPFRFVDPEGRRPADPSSWSDADWREFRNEDALKYVDALTGAVSAVRDVLSGNVGQAVVGLVASRVPGLAAAKNLQRVKAVLEGGRVTENSKRVVNVVRSGGREAAEEAFAKATEGLEVATTQTSKGIVRSADLPDGGSISIRSHSSRPGETTIQMNLEDGPKVATRFVE